MYKYISFASAFRHVGRETALLRNGLLSVGRQARVTMMIRNSSRFSTSVGTMAVAGCVLQLASFAAQAESARVIATAANSPSSAVSAQGDVRSLSVSYRDLNLSNPEGVHALMARIDRAADDVCGAQPSSILSSDRSQAERQCKAAAVASAMAQVDARLVRAKVAAGQDHNCADATHANAVAQLHAAMGEEDATSR